MEDFSAARRKMVDSQLRTEAVTDYDILAAMGSVPRERFVPEDQRAVAYIDSDVPLKSGTPSRYLMEAAPFARLLQLAEIDTDDRILDVGCGTGYSLAVLAALGGFVVGLESDAELAAAAKANLAALGIGNAKVVSGALDAGYPVDGPYDVIFLEGAVEVLPAGLFEQLREGGRLVAVVGYGRAAMATVYAKSEGHLGQRAAFNTDVRPLPGFRKPEVFVF
ncbi:MAG TPA: protein-L-isoaspartate O-methyltransferase [Bauldia sp.]|nr:protein-L-isoaspartate O-methyltransferase [Bauldia sp.]